MKIAMLIEFYNKLKANPKLMRKVKIFAAVAAVGFISLGGVVIWASVSALNYVVTTTSQVIASPAAQVQFQPVRCWGKAQSLAMVQPWLDNTALTNLRNLKEACLGSSPLETTNEGSKI